MKAIITSALLVGLMFATGCSCAHRKDMKEGQCPYKKCVAEVCNKCEACKSGKTTCSECSECKEKKAECKNRDYTKKDCNKCEKSEQCEGRK
jgi:hypothetical protein